MSVFRFLGAGALYLTLQYSAIAQSSSDYYEQALTAYDSGKMDTAFIHLKNALQENATHLPSRLLLGKIYFENGIFSEAEHELKLALEAGADINLVLPKLGNALLLQDKVDELLALERYFHKLDRYGQFEWHLLQGQAFLRQEKHDFAEQEFKLALTKARNDVRALNTLASYYLDNENIHRALELTESSLELDQNNSKTLLIRAKAFQLQANYQQSHTLLQQAYEAAPEDPLILRALSLSFIRLGDVEQGIKLNEELLALAPYDPAALLVKANHLQNQGKNEEAEVILAELSSNLSLVSDSADGKQNLLLGISASMQDNQQAAIDAYEAYLEKKPDDTYAISLLVNQYLSTGDKNKAIDVLQRRYRPVYKNLGLGTQLVSLLLAEGNPFKAGQVIRELERNFSNQPILIRLQAQVYSATDQHQLALQSLETIAPDLRDNAYWQHKAKSHLILGQTEAAKSIVAKLVDGGDLAGSANFLNLRAAVAMATNELDQAQQLSERALAIDANNTDSKYNLASIKMLQGQFEDAEVGFQKILEQAPEHQMALTRLVDLAIRQGNWQTAQSRIDTLLNYYPEDIFASEMQTQLYIQTNQWNQALKQLVALRQLDGLNPKYLLQQAAVFSALDNAEDAQQNYQILYELWIDDASLLQRLAQAQIDAQAWQSAQQTLTRILALEPDQPWAAIQQARAALVEQDLTRANNLITKLTDKFGDIAEVTLLKGDLALALNDISQASDWYQATLKKDPRRHVALIKLYQLSKQGKIEREFFDTANELLAQQNQPVWVRKLLADGYMNAGDLGLAEFHYKKLMGTEQFSRSAAIMNNLANIYAKDNLTAALEAGLLAIEYSEGKSAAIHDTVGWIYARQQKFNEALSHLREAAVLDANNAEINYHLGFVLHKLGRKEEAIRQLRMATMSDDYAEFDEAKALLNSL